MAVKSAQVSVGTTATPLTSAAQTADYVAGSNATITVPAAGVTVYLGGPGVTTSTGFRLTAGAGQSVDLQAGERLYGIVASGTQTVDVLESGV